MKCDVMVPASERGHLPQGMACAMLCPNKLPYRRAITVHKTQFDRRCGNCGVDNCFEHVLAPVGCGCDNELPVACWQQGRVVT